MHATSHGVAARFLLQPQKMRSVLSPEPLASFLRSRGSATMQVPLAWQLDVQRKRLLWSAPDEILRYGASKLKAYLPKSQGQSFAAVHVRAQAATECLSLAGLIGPTLAFTAAVSFLPPLVCKCPDLRMSGWFRERPSRHWTPEYARVAATDSFFLGGGWWTFHCRVPLM